MVANRMSVESKQTVFIHCYSCIGLAPNEESRKIKAKVHISFLGKKFSTFTAKEWTRNPIINEVASKQCEMPDNLQFLSQIHVTVSNDDGKSKPMFEPGYSKEIGNEIGSIAINPGDLVDGDTGDSKSQAKKSLLGAKFEPQVYTLKNRGKIVGKIVLSISFIKGTL